MQVKQRHVALQNLAHEVVRRIAAESKVAKVTQDCNSALGQCAALKNELDAMQQNLSDARLQMTELHDGRGCEAQPCAKGPQRGCGMQPFHHGIWDRAHCSEFAQHDTCMAPAQLLKLSFGSANPIKVA